MKADIHSKLIAQLGRKQSHLSFLGVLIVVAGEVIFVSLLPFVSSGIAFIESSLVAAATSYSTFHILTPITR